MGSDEIIKSTSGCSDLSLKKERSELDFSAARCRNDSTSDDSQSIEEDEDSSILARLFKVQENQSTIFEFESRVGLNGSQVHSSFPCLLDQ